MGAPGPDMATPPPDMAGTTPGDVLLPEGIALMAAAARKPDGSPGIAYYDRTRGNLRLVEWNPSTNAWNKPVMLDGEDAMGNDLGDVGLYPSLIYDGMNVAHISYENASKDSLLYINNKTKMPEVVDDGYRPKDEQTHDGLDSPVWHLVGDSSSIQLQSGNDRHRLSGLDGADAAAGDQGLGRQVDQAVRRRPRHAVHGLVRLLRQPAGQRGQGVLSSYAINQQLERSALLRRSLRRSISASFSSS